MDEFNISSKDYELFSRFLEKSCGIVLGKNKQYLIKSRLSSLMEENSLKTVGEVVENANKKNNQKFQISIIDAMTTNETSWFRDVYPYEFLKGVILPEHIKNKDKPIRIWSAACSTGQEPYSISMMIREFKNMRPGLTLERQIIATDISPLSIRTAKAGIYDKLSLARGLSTERRQAFFINRGSCAEVKVDIRHDIIFSEANLMKSMITMGKFDIIFCRNVLIYFSPAIKDEIISRMMKQLKPRGYLIVGGTESIASFTRYFETITFQGGLLYKLK